MLAVPYLLLFSISLAFQIIAHKKPKALYSKIGYGAGALCGLYIVFMIWLAAGWGERSSASYAVTINGKIAYVGLSHLFPLVIFAFILIPGMSYGIRFIAGMLLNFVYIREDNLPQQDNMLHPFAKFLVTLCAVVLYVAVGSLPLILMLHNISPGERLLDYIDGNFIQFAFCAMLLAVWLLITVRIIVNKIALLRLRRRKKGK